MSILASVRRVCARPLDRALRFGIIASAVLASLTTLGTAAAYASGYRVNTTPSMPLGVWQIARDDAPARGAVVWVCPPQSAEFRQARRYGFVPHGFCPGGFNPLLKPIAAVPGDRVTVGVSGISVNGHPLANTAAAVTDAQGRRLPQIPHGTHTVRPGQVWLISTYSPSSFDSRYFGPVPANGIVGRAAPVVISEDHP